MDLSRYDETTRELIKGCVAQVAAISEDAPKTIRRAKSVAKKKKDDYLLGLVCYHEAMYVYYTADDGAAYRPLLNEAARHILRSEDNALLARLYNFIAVDAHDHGCFDMAYNYYIMSLRFSREPGDAGAVALCEANIGRLFAELEEPVLARTYIRRSLASQRKQKADLRYNQNIMILLVNDGLVSLMMGDTVAAGKDLKKLDGMLSKADDNEKAELELPRTFLYLQLLLARADKKRFAKQLEILVDVLKQEPAPQNYSDDICNLSRVLIQKKMFREAGIIIDAADKKIMASDNTYVMYQFCILKADYYEACGSERRMIAAMRKQRELSAKMRMEQRLLNKFSVELSSLISELREEHKRMRKENAVLQVQAQTDALTGMPNRYIMNRQMEKAFDRAWKGKYPLGVEILDVDHFKEYNDTYGHPAGDRCLELIAQALTKMAEREGIFCARYGGDEFVILYENMSDAAIRKEAQALEAVIASFHLVHKASPVSDRVTVSQGICNHVPTGKNKPWDYLSIADAALYAVKKERGKKKMHASIRFKQMPADYAPSEQRSIIQTDARAQELKRYIKNAKKIRELSNPRINAIQGDDTFRSTMLENFSRIGELSRKNVEILDRYFFPLLKKESSLLAGERQVLKAFSDALMDPYTLDHTDICLAYLQLERQLKDKIKDDDLYVRMLDDFVTASYNMMYSAVCVYPCSEIFTGYRETGLKAARKILSYLDKKKFLRLKTDEAKESVLIMSRYICALFERPDAPGDEKWNAEELELMRRSIALKDDPFYAEHAPAFDWRYQEFRACEFSGGLTEYNNIRGFNKEQLEELYELSGRAFEIYENDSAFFSGLSDINSLKTQHIRNGYLTGRITVEDYKKELVAQFQMHREQDEGHQDLSAVIILAEYLALLKKGNISKEDAKTTKRLYDELVLIINAQARRGTFVAAMFYLSNVLKNYVEIPGGESFESFCLSMMTALHPPTYVHSLNVATLAKIMTIHLVDKNPVLFTGMPGFETTEDVIRKKDEIIDYVYHAALCHDFGKLLIIETIRTYARKLLDLEMDMIRLHAEAGAYLLELHEDTKKYADVARGHHKWFDDAKGYPDGFDPRKSPYRTAISIIACADCLDAATDAVGRSYKDGKRFDDFLAELRDGSGTRYAPYMLELFSDKKVRGDLEMQLANGRENNYRKAFRRLKKHE